MRRLWIPILLAGARALAAPGAEPQEEPAVPVERAPIRLPVLWEGARAPGPGVFEGLRARPAMTLSLAAGDRVAPQRTQERPPERPKSNWRPALAASAALAATGAAVAWWSTGEADAAYDRYLRSAGAGRQQQAFERAERHDRIAGAAFLVMEAGIVLGACILFF